MIWISLALVLVSLAAIPVSRRRTGDFFSPASLVIVIWFTTLSLYLLGLFPYAPLSERAVLLIFLSLAALLGGLWAGHWLVWRRGRDQGQASALPSVRAAEIWLTAYSIIGIVGFAWYVRDVVHYLGWRAFASGASIRWALADKTIPSEYLFPELFCIIAPLVAFAFVICGVRLRLRLWVAPLLCVAMLWLTTDRTQFFTLVLTATWMSFLRLGPALTTRRVVRTLALVGVILVSNFWAVGAWLGKTPENLGVALQFPHRGEPALSLDMLPQAKRGESKSGVHHVPSSRFDRVLQKFSTLYLYATGSYAAFSVLVDEPPDGTGGAHTFYPILRALDRVHLFPGTLPAAIPPYRVITDEDAPRKIEYNAYTYLYYPYNDLGDAGVALVPLMIGVLCGALYAWLRRRRASPLALVWMAQVYLALMLSMFVSKFNNTASWYIAFFTGLPFLPRVSLAWGRAARADGRGSGPIGPNLDSTTVEGFGKQWSVFDQKDLAPAEQALLFQRYFRIFPWEQLPRESIGADVGCGAGRWAALVAPHAGRLYCFDASLAAARVARENLQSLSNCAVSCASAERLPVPDGSLDFVYSLGVLHHLPDPGAAMRACVAKLKPGAPFLVYLYYALDNRPAWYRAVWRMSDLVRRAVAVLPFLLRYALTQAIAVLVYLPLARTARWLERGGRQRGSVAAVQLPESEPLLDPNRRPGSIRNAARAKVLRRPDSRDDDLGGTRADRV